MLTDAHVRALCASGVVGLCSWTLGRTSAPITEADDAFLAILGYDRATYQHAAPLDWRALTPTESAARLEERFAELIDIGAHGPREQQIVTRNGEHASVLVASCIVDAATGAAVSICFDLGEQMRARVDAEGASQAKSRFLAVMNHELRTPLNSIIGQTELILDGAYGSLTDPQRTALARLARAGNQLRSLVDDVLSFTRLETGAAQYVMTDVGLADALTAVASAAQSQASAKSITIEVRPPAESLRVRADADKLRDVLAGLLANAVKFTPSGGTITLETTQRTAVAEYVFVRVTDTGSGIARARQEAIFEPFTQQDEGRTRTATGLGLGLTISRDLARGMGGDLRVRSTEGGGSTFTLSLRCAKPAADATHPE